VKEQTRKLLEKAERAIGAANTLYGMEAITTAEDAATMITQAREFLEAARRYLGPAP
jgi:uncharacterized protein (UPF0332 family)